MRLVDGRGQERSAEEHDADRAGGQGGAVDLLGQSAVHGAMFLSARLPIQDAATVTASAPGIIAGIDVGGTKVAAAAAVGPRAQGLIEQPTDLRGTGELPDGIQLL